MGPGIFTYMYHQNEANVGKYASTMDPMGVVKLLHVRRWHIHHIEITLGNLLPAFWSTWVELAPEFGELHVASRTLCIWNSIMILFNK